MKKINYKFFYHKNKNIYYYFFNYKIKKNIKVGVTSMLTGSKLG